LLPETKGPGQGLSFQRFKTEELGEGCGFFGGETFLLSLEASPVRRGGAHDVTGTQSQLNA
jgi:hypothetical protein